MLMGMSDNQASIINAAARDWNSKLSNFMHFLNIFSNL